MREENLTLAEILDGLGIPEEHHDLAGQLLSAQQQMREQLGREPNRRERRAFESKMRRAMNAARKRGKR